MSKLAAKSIKVAKPKVQEPKVEEPKIQEKVPEPKVEPKVEETQETQEQEQQDTMKNRFELLIKEEQEMIVASKKRIQEFRKMQRDHEHLIKESAKRSKKKRLQKI